MPLSAQASIRVTVVVPTCNRPDLLDKCLDALVKQDICPSAYEVIVVDDAARNETRQQVSSWAVRLQDQGYTIRYLPMLPLSSGPAPHSTSRRIVPTPLIQDYPWHSYHDLASEPSRPSRITRGIHATTSPHNPTPTVAALHAHGPAAARNAGWRAARAPIIAFTDDDCLPTCGWLQAGLRAMQCGAAGASGRLIMPLPPCPTDYERNAAHLEHAEFITANSFYRRDALATIGGFDQRFRLAWREDSDLHFRLLEQDARLVQAPDAVVIHPVRRARWGVSLSQQRKSMYNALLYKKHPALYRQRIQPAPPWRYYCTVAALLLALTGAITTIWPLALLASVLWLTLTTLFCLRRLRRTSHSPAHIAEMAFTSALIPPLAIFWRLRGALTFRVPFL